MVSNLGKDLMYRMQRKEQGDLGELCHSAWGERSKKEERRELNVGKTSELDRIHSGKAEEKS